MNILFNETDLLKQLAELLLYVDENGWDSVEVRTAQQESWHEVGASGRDCFKVKWTLDAYMALGCLEARAKQKTITVYSSSTGKPTEVPAPYKGDLDSRLEYWVESRLQKNLSHLVYFNGANNDYWKLSEYQELGLLHLTKENAQISARAKL